MSLGVETDAPNVRIIVYPRDPDQRGERTRAGWGRDLPLARATQPRSDAVMYAGEIYDRTVPRRTTGPRHRDRDAVHRVRLAAPHGCTATLLHLQYLQLCTDVVVHVYAYYKHVRCMQNCTPKNATACICMHRSAPHGRCPAGPPSLRPRPRPRPPRPAGVAPVSLCGGHRVRAAVKRERRRLYLFFLGGDVVNSYLSRGVSNARRDRDRDRGALSKHTHVGARGALAARLPWSDIGCSVFGVRTPTQLEGTPTTLGVRGAFKNTHM